MDNILNSSVLKIIVVLALPCLGYIASKMVEFRGLRKIPKARQEALKGTWKGKVDQTDGVAGYPHNYEVTFEIKTFWKFIYGHAKYELNGTKTTLDFVGGFYNEHYLMMKYRNKHRKIIQYGLGMFKFGARANDLDGRFLGYGHLSEDLVSGYLTLKKVK